MQICKRTQVYIERQIWKLKVAETLSVHCTALPFRALAWCSQTANSFPFLEFSIMMSQTVTPAHLTWLNMLGLPTKQLCIYKLCLTWRGENVCRLIVTLFTFKSFLFSSSLTWSCSTPPPKKAEFCHQVPSRHRCIPYAEGRLPASFCIHIKPNLNAAVKKVRTSSSHLKKG